MPPENPLEIPEVASLVASYLKGKDLASCVRVCKRWRDLFLPHRWRVTQVGTKPDDFGLGPPGAPLDRVGPCPDDIYYHRHLIKHLRFLRELAGLDKYHYPNLRTLTIDFFRGASYPDRFISLELTEMFPVLTDLNIWSVEMAPRFWKTLSEHPHLRYLHIWESGIKAESVREFWMACKKLESLRIVEVAIEGEGPFPKDLVFDRIRRLDLERIEGLDRATQLDLIFQCPKLERVQWTIQGSIDDLHPPLIRHPVWEGRWPHLNKLDLHCGLHDTNLAFMLEKAGNVVEFRSSRCTFGPQASRALGLHFSTLVMLNLESCRSIASSTTRDILCQCPKLEELYAGNVTIKDIAEGGPWVCLQLRMLALCFWVGESDQDLQPLVYERMSTLVRLERLKMHAFDTFDGRVLEFRLECGMDKLASLRNLTAIFFVSNGQGPYIPQLGMDEVAWMKVHWKKLEGIVGRLNRNQVVDADLKNALNLLGIQAY